MNFNFKELFDIMKSLNNIPNKTSIIIIVFIFTIFSLPEKIKNFLKLDVLINKYGFILGLVLIFSFIVLVFNCIGLVVNIVKKINKKYRYKKTLKKTLYNLDDKSKQIILVLYYKKIYEFNSFDNYIRHLGSLKLIKKCNINGKREAVYVNMNLYKLSEQVIELLQSDNDLFNNFKEVCKLK